MTNTYIVTGSNRGFGFSVTHALLKKGYSVIASFHSKPTVSLLSLQKEYSTKLSLLELSLESSESIKEFTRKVMVKKRSIQGIVCNAASRNYIGLLSDVSMENIRKLVEINCVAQIEFIQSILRANILSHPSSIVNVTSFSAFKAFNYLAPYCISKAAFEMATKCLSLELQSKEIRVNSIGISANTKLYKSHATQKAKLGYTKTLDRIKRGEVLPAPEKSVGTVLYLLSNESLGVTGQHIEASSMFVQL